MESAFENFKDVSDNSQILVKVFKNAHEGILNAGTISYWTQEMKDTLKFPNLYDLKFAEENLLWFEEILSEKKRAELHAEYGDETDPNKRIDIIQKILSSKDFPSFWQDYLSINQRSANLRKDLMSWIKENDIKDHELIQVSHSRLLRSFCCEEFDAETGNPVEGKYKNFVNAEIFEYELHVE